MTLIGCRRTGSLRIFQIIQEYGVRVNAVVALLQLTQSALCGGCRQSSGSTTSRTVLMHLSNNQTAEIFTIKANAFGSIIMRLTEGPIMFLNV